MFRDSIWICRADVAHARLRSSSLTFALKLYRVQIMSSARFGMASLEETEISEIRSPLDGRNVTSNNQPEECTVSIKSCELRANKLTAKY